MEKVSFFELSVLLLFYEDQPNSIPRVTDEDPRCISGTWMRLTFFHGFFFFGRLIWKGMEEILLEAFLGEFLRTC